ETKEIYKEIVNAVINRQELLNMIKTKKYLPIIEIEKETGIHRKKIERSRKYVITMIIILTGEYKYIQDFINWG
ncbi:MAG: RNA polymerase subunit sigma, partial [Bacteroidota bacterium]|nr:RNA polymerase subunit sigma [Bacteroidota bacterium]